MRKVDMSNDTEGRYPKPIPPHYPPVSERLTVDEWWKAMAHLAKSVKVEMTIDVHMHPTAPTEEAGSVTRKLDLILTQLTNAAKQESFQMATVQELNAKIDTLKTSVEAETNLRDSIVTWMQGQGSIAAELRRQLKAALEAGGDQSAALQAAVDTLDVIQKTNDANAKDIADAMIVNTPAEP
jgi:hypothetical protein